MTTNNNPSMLWLGYAIDDSYVLGPIRYLPPYWADEYGMILLMEGTRPSCL